MPAKQKKQNDVPEPRRRSFLNKLWIGLGIIALVEIVAVVFAFLRPNASKAKGEDSGMLIEAGPVKSFSNQSVTAFVRGKFYLTRLDDGGFLALSRVCTHLGCTVPWVEAENRFVCPCHASIFDIRGDVIKSPASRPLDIFQVSIENNSVKVDTGHPIKRSEFREEQVVYPKQG